MQEKFAELMKDETFVKELLALETTEEVQKALAEKGVDFSIEEIEGIRKEIISGVSSEEEMNDDQLEQVAGGAIRYSPSNNIINIPNIRPFIPNIRPLITPSNNPPVRW